MAPNSAAPIGVKTDGGDPSWGIVVEVQENSRRLRYKKILKKRLTTH